MLARGRFEGRGYRAAIPNITVREKGTGGKRKNTTVVDYHKDSIERSAVRVQEKCCSSKFSIPLGDVCSARKKRITRYVLGASRGIVPVRAQPRSKLRDLWLSAS